jgi:outer membrane protein OmpA-like peptidoglycan-associated protein
VKETRVKFSHMPTLILCLLLLFSASGIKPAEAVPTVSGDTGLLTQPSAQTLDAGNISFGLWYHQTSGPSGSARTVPVAMTLGLGSFLEVYGAYPNLLFNDDAIHSGRGNIQLGFKARVFGKRADIFRIAVDLQGRRSVSDNPDLDGVNSYQARVIASFKKERFGLHANMGYRFNDDPGTMVEFDDQLVAGFGIEFAPLTRLRLLAEMEFASEKVEGEGEEGEATLGIRYFLSPHLTLHAATSFGLLDASPDWRTLLGFSTSQGVGTYLKPVPRIIQPADEEDPPEAPAAEVDSTKKIRPLSPLLAGQVKPRQVGQVEKLEVPVEARMEEIILTKEESFPEQAPSAVKTHSLNPLAPMSVPEQKAAQDNLQNIGAKESPASIGTPIPAFVYRKFRLPELSFDFDQWSLSDEGKKALSEIIASLREDTRWFFLRIDGHTDDIGSEQYNMGLSLKRAISMGSYLVDREGIDAGRIFVKGFGESSPVASNETEEGRSQNRRVEILVLVPRESWR